MLKIVVLLTGLMCSWGVMVNHAYAHGAGGHGSHVVAKDVVNLASRYVVSIVKKERPIEGQVLDRSWLSISAKNKKIARDESWYFVVSVRHTVQKKTLYLMISKKGKLYRANFNGVFKDFE